jgi:hypothetical protein
LRGFVYGAYCLKRLFPQSISLEGFIFIRKNDYSGGAVKIASLEAGKPGCDSGIVSKPSFTTISRELMLKKQKSPQHMVSI